MTPTLAPRTLRRSAPLPGSRSMARPARRLPGFVPLLAAEVFAAALGFGVMVHLARRLGPSGFADFEYASAVAAWWLVLVRGGFDAIACREAARRPRLARPITEVLLGLRLASAAVGLAAIAGMAWAAGPDRGRVVAVAGLVLIPSALASDVGLRASGRFGRLAAAQSIRVAGLAIGVGWLVMGPGRALAAAGCLVAAEVASTLALLGLGADQIGVARPRFRRRAWAILARRGAIAGLARFLRVTLYAADLVALGWAAGATLGPYSAARRVAFALLGLGLVVPTALAPSLARAWAAGPAEARDRLARASRGLGAVAWPAALGLAVSADRWMPLLFGPGFRDGGPWLAWVALRVPLILASNLQQTALIAARREVEGLKLLATMAGLALILIPPLSLVGGPWGVATGLLAVEGSGVALGRRALWRLDLVPGRIAVDPAVAAGCLAVGAIGLLGRAWPLGAVVVASVAAYGSILGPRIARGGETS